MPRYTPEYCESLLAANPQACEALYDRIMRGKVIADMADHTTFVLKALEEGPKSAVPVAVWCRANGDPNMEGELARRICDRLVREGRAFKDGQVYSAATVEISPAPAAREDERVSVETGLNEFEWVAPPKPAPTTSQEAAPIHPIRSRESAKTIVSRKLPASREAIVWPDIMKLCSPEVKIGEPIYINVPTGKSAVVFAQDIRGRLHSGEQKRWIWGVSHLTDGNYVEVKKLGVNTEYPDRAVQPAATLAAFGGTHSSIYDSLYAAVSHIDIKIAALQADRDRLIDMAQRFQEQV